MSAKPIQLLLIDDQPLVAAAIRRLLESAPDLILTYCQDVAQGIQAAPAADIILLDLVLPGADGLELIRGFRANPSTAHRGIMTISSREDAKSRAAAFDAGTDDFVPKLPESIELIARIRRLARRTSP